MPFSLWSGNMSLHYEKATVLRFKLIANIGIYHFYTSSSDLWAELVPMFIPGYVEPFVVLCHVSSTM